MIRRSRLNLQTQRDLLRLNDFPGSQFIAGLCDRIKSDRPVWSRAEWSVKAQLLVIPTNFTVQI